MGLASGSCGAGGVLAFEVEPQSMDGGLHPVYTARAQEIARSFGAPKWCRMSY